METNCGGIGAPIQSDESVWDRPAAVEFWDWLAAAEFGDGCIDDTLDCAGHFAAEASDDGGPVPRASAPARCVVFSAGVTKCIAGFFVAGSDTGDWLFSVGDWTKLDESKILAWVVFLFLVGGGLSLRCNRI